MLQCCENGLSYFIGDRCTDERDVFGHCVFILKSHVIIS